MYWGGQGEVANRVTCQGRLNVRPKEFVESHTDMLSFLS